MTLCWQWGSDIYILDISNFQERGWAFPIHCEFNTGQYFCCQMRDSDGFFFFAKQLQRSPVISPTPLNLSLNCEMSQNYLYIMLIFLSLTSCYSTTSL